MKVVLYGATGMIGRGALLECLDDPRVEKVLAVVRRPTGEAHDKLEELTLEDFTDYTNVDLCGYDACLYCLGITAAGMSEADYRRITYDFTVAAGETLLRDSPGIRMCFISGAGTELSSGQMWARVKAEAEQWLLQQPFESAHMFRPGAIEPRRGIKSGVRLYRVAYAMMGWSFPLLKKLMRGKIVTTTSLGKALIEVGLSGCAYDILETHQINEIVPCD